MILLTAAGAMAQDKAIKERADSLHSGAAQEPNSGKAAVMLCQAAALVPKNADYQNDCNNAKRAVLDVDQRNLTRAIEAGDAGKLDSAKRYAGMISALDPKLHEQAAQLIAKWNAPVGGAPAQPAAPATPAGPSPSVVALNQAQTAFDSGNLGAAKSAAQQVTDASIKPSATRLVNEIDRYQGLVAAGQRAQEAKDYSGAERSFQSALDINPHVGGDDLNGKLQRLHQLASAPTPTAPTPAAPPPVVARNNVPATPAAKPPEISLDAKKEKLQDVYAMAIGRKDLEGADRALRQIVALDPRDMEAKNHLTDVEKQLAEIVNRDPVKLEKTLHDAIAAFYASQFEDAESELNRYLGADAGKKKGAAYFYLGATEQARALLDAPSKHTNRQAQARDYFKQARSAGYQPIPKYVSEKILQAWQQAGS